MWNALAILAGGKKVPWIGWKGFHCHCKISHYIHVFHVNKKKKLWPSKTPGQCPVIVFLFIAKNLGTKESLFWLRTLPLFILHVQLVIWLLPPTPFPFKLWSPEVASCLFPCLPWVHLLFSSNMSSSSFSAPFGDSWASRWHINVPRGSSPSLSSLYAPSWEISSTSTSGAQSGKKSLRI